MPWCDECDRFYNPNSLSPDGTCPRCGTKLPVPRVERRAVADAARRAAGESGGESDGERKGVPWHFWMLLVALVIYLGYRFFQGIVWVVHKL